MKDNSFHLNQVFLNTLDSKQLLSVSHLENISAYISGKSLSILLAKTSFAFLLISMLSYWFQMSFKSTLRIPRGSSKALAPQGITDTRGIPTKSVISVTGNDLFTKSIDSVGVERRNLLEKVPLITMWFANITLALLLSIRWIESGHFPLSNLYESLIFLSWSLTIIHLFLENLFYKNEQILGSTPTLTLGAITSPVALFTNAFATFSLPQEMQKVTVLVPALKSNWLIMHVSVMIISYAALLSGSILAMAFLVVKFLDDNKIPSIVYTFIMGFKKTNSVSLIAQFIDRRLSKKLNSNNPLTTNSFDVSKATIGVSTANPSLLMSQASLQTQSYITSNTRSELNKPASQTTPSTCSESNEDENNLLLTPISYANPQQATDSIVAKQSFAQPTELEAEGSKSLLLKGSPKETDSIGMSTASAMVEIKNFQFLDLPHILDNLSYRSIGLGFALLTIGILSGAVWANEAWGSYWSWDPKETWAFITWLVFALYLHTRLSKGWVGKDSAFVASFGFVVIWFCYLGVNLFGKGLHSYGWFQR